MPAFANANSHQQEGIISPVLTLSGMTGEDCTNEKLTPVFV